MNTFSSLESTVRPGLAIDDALDPYARLDYVEDTLLTLVVQLGMTQLKLRDVLDLRQSSVIALSVFAGEPLEIFINHRLVAKGEAVVVNDKKLGIRLTDIVTPSERTIKGGRRSG